MDLNITINYLRSDIGNQEAPKKLSVFFSALKPFFSG